MKQVIIPSTLQDELHKFLIQLETHACTEDVQPFDKLVSGLIDCIHYLLEEGGHAG